MYASIRRYTIPAGSVDTLMDQINKRFSNIVSGTDGFIAYYANDAGGGQVVTVGIFETQEAADASGKLAAQWVAQNFASRGDHKPHVAAGPVKAHRLPDEPL